MDIKINDSFISGTPVAYNVMGCVHEQIVRCKDNDIFIYVEIDKRIGTQLLFYLSTLPLLGKSWNESIFIYGNDKVIKLLKKGGYIDKVNNEINNKTNIAVLLEKSCRIIVNQQDIFDIVTDITAQAPVEMNENLSEIFISKVKEMFNNATEHSNAKYIIGAKYFKNKRNIYCFSCYDTGIGIPDKVTSYISSTLSDIEKMRWAMQIGNSTANENWKIPRGIGLELLIKFAKVNDAVIRICSGNVLYVYKNNDECYYELKNKFQGTLFEIEIIFDNDHRYII